MLKHLIWRAGDRLVVQRGEVFVVLTSLGELTARFTPSAFSDEDDLWSTAHQVVAGELRERTVIEHGGDAERVYEEKVLVRGLLPVDDAETRRLVEVALTTMDSESARAEAQRSTLASARVAAIDGAFEDFGVSRAQEALRERIFRWNDERAATLLRMLVTLGRAHVGVEVLQVFARGCLFACFEAPAETPASAGVKSKELSEAISVLAGELESDAEGQELSDAMQNASAFRKAAREFRRAAQLLGT